MNKRIAARGIVVSRAGALSVLLLAALSGTAAAATLVCPDLSAAAQVNACPPDEELKFTYSGFCSDNAKAYANQTDSCIRYED